MSDLAKYVHSYSMKTFVARLTHFTFVISAVGLVSLRERAAELGGRSEVTCPATGGTLVRAWLPLTHHSDRNPS